MLQYLIFAKKETDLIISEHYLLHKLQPVIKFVEYEIYFMEKMVICMLKIKFLNVYYVLNMQTNLEVEILIFLGIKIFSLYKIFRKRVMYHHNELRHDTPNSLITLNFVFPPVRILIPRHEIARKTQDTQQNYFEMGDKDNFIERTDFSSFGIFLLLL